MEPAVGFEPSKQRLPKSNQFLVSDADAAPDTHIAISRFLVNLGKCVSRSLDSRERSDVSDDEHQAVKVASRVAYECSGGYRDLSVVTSIRSHRVAYHGILLRRLLHALDHGADGIGRLAVLLYDNAHREMRPVTARCAPSAKSVVLEIILSNRRVTVDSHGAGGGWN